MRASSQASGETGSPIVSRIEAVNAKLHQLTHRNEEGVARESQAVNGCEQ